MKLHCPIFLGVVTALGLAGWTSPSEAQSVTLSIPGLFGQGASPYPYVDPYRADTPSYPYGPPRYGSPYDPGYSRPSLPEDPPYGAYPPHAGYGPPVYRDSYRPPFPGPGPVPGHVPGYGVPGHFASPRLIGLADTLAGQVNGFLQAFSATAGDVPEGERFLADAHSLAEATARFRQLLASGVPPSQLSMELRGVDAAWQRLQLRTQRIARGRTGPNIQNIALMGDTIRQMQMYLP